MRDRQAWLLVVASCGLVVAGSSAPALADGPGVLISRRAKSDFPLTADPEAKDWKGAPAVIADRNPKGEVVPGHRTEIRSRWTKENLYLLFICPYEALYLKPEPVLDADTNKLWEW